MSKPSPKLVIILIVAAILAWHLSKRLRSA